MLKGFGAKLKALFGMNTFDERYFENLEDFLIEGDLGAKLATQISDEVRKLAKSEKPKTQKDLQILVKRLLSDKIRIFDPGLEEGEPDCLFDSRSERGRQDHFDSKTSPVLQKSRKAGPACRSRYIPRCSHRPIGSSRPAAWLQDCEAEKRQ